MRESGRPEIADRLGVGIFAPGCVSKDEMMREWSALGGMQDCTTVAIGNNTIDLSAFEACDLSAAVSNAQREALKAAGMIIEKTMKRARHDIFCRCLAREKKTRKQGEYIEGTQALL